VVVVECAGVVVDRAVDGALLLGLFIYTVRAPEEQVVDVSGAAARQDKSVVLWVVLLLL